MCRIPLPLMRKQDINITDINKLKDQDILRNISIKFQKVVWNLGFSENAILLEEGQLVNMILTSIRNASEILLGR